MGGGSETQNGRFPCKIALRLKKVCYKVSLCENCQRQSCKAFIGLTICAEMIGGGRPLLCENDPPVFRGRRFRMIRTFVYPHSLEHEPHWHRRRSGWTSGGRMASAEGGSVPSGVEYGEGCPLSSRLGSLGSVVSSPSGVRGRARPKTDFGVF